MQPNPMAGTRRPCVPNVTSFIDLGLLVWRFILDQHGNAALDYSRPIKS
jgi:hypothetical protein